MSFETINSEINDNAFEEYKKFYLKLLIKCKNNSQKMILICNLNKSNDIPLNYVMKQAQFNKEIYEFNKKYLVCVCILCTNSNFSHFKNIINLCTTMMTPASPVKLCNSFDNVNKYLLKIDGTVFDSNIFTRVSNKDESTEQTTAEEYEVPM